MGYNKLGSEVYWTHRVDAESLKCLYNLKADFDSELICMSGRTSLLLATYQRLVT